MPGPIATVGSMHVCPMCSGTVPHVGGPVSQGSANVLANGKPLATAGSMCVCVGPPDVIISGEANVLTNNMPTATLGSSTAHGGAVVAGEPNILVGTGASAPSTITLADRLATPKITPIDKVLASVSGNRKTMKEAEKQQAENQEEAKQNGFLGHFGFSI